MDFRSSPLMEDLLHEQRDPRKASQVKGSEGRNGMCPGMLFLVMVWTVS